MTTDHVDTKPEPIATIKNAERTSKNKLNGFIFGDKLGRFVDGYPVNVVFVEELGDDLVRTPSGNVYKVEILIDRTQAVGGK